MKNEVEVYARETILTVLPSQDSVLSRSVNPSKSTTYAWKGTQEGVTRLICKSTLEELASNIKSAFGANHYILTCNVKEVEQELGNSFIKIRPLNSEEQKELNNLLKNNGTN